MIRHKLCLSGIFLMLASLSIHAQTGLGLSKVWEMTLMDYPGMTLKQAQLEESKISLKLTRQTNYFPSLQLQLQNAMGTYAGSSGAFFPLPGVINVNGSGYTLPGQRATAFNSFGSVVADWKFFEFGRKKISMKAAGQGIEQARSDLNAQQIKLKAQSAQLYVNLLNSKINLLWSVQNAARARQIFELSASLSFSGLKPGADSALALSSYLQSLAGNALWNAKLEADLINLKELAPHIDTAQGIAYTDYLKPAPITAFNKLPGADHPYLQVLRQAAGITRTQAELASLRAFPSVSALGGLALKGSGIGKDGRIDNHLFGGYGNGASNYLLGLAVTWNLTSAYTSASEKQRILQRVRSDDAQYAMQERELDRQLHAGTIRLEGQIKQIHHTSAAVAHARSAYDLYLSRYENGLIDLTALLQIQSRLQEAEKMNIDTHQQLWEQVLILSEASGDFSYLQNQFN